MFSKIGNLGSKIDMRIYLAGYSGLLMARWLRRLMARSDWHRSWLSGHMGSFLKDDGSPFGVCDRVWYSWRKGALANECSLARFLYAIVFNR
jgi:hypothetical protein